MNIALSQLGPKWANDLIKGTKLTLGRWGCTITSVCMAMRKAGFEITPPEAAKRFQFTPDGLLKWTSDFQPIKFVERCSYDKKKLDDWLDIKSNYAILQVDGFHWVFADRFNPLFGHLQAIDPLGGVPIKVLKKYKKITGMALFTKI